MRSSFRIIVLSLLCVTASTLTTWGQQGNLLKFGDIETPNAANSRPQGWEQGGDIDGVQYSWADQGYKSKHSLCIKKTEKRYFPIAGWFQEIPDDGTAKKLRISAYVKAYHVTKAVLDAEFEGKKSTHQWAAYIGPQKPKAKPFTHSWKRYTGIVDVPAGTKQISIGTEVYGPGTIWFDDVTVEAVP